MNLILMKPVNISFKKCRWIIHRQQSRKFE
nr:MAG TPA: hypothetical protein [Caudoviricetes sp.]